MFLQHKSIPFDVKQLTEVADVGWEVAGYASTFGGEPDSYGDVVLRGAFQDSIDQRATKFLFEHREPIGRQLELREDDRGLFGRWTIVDTSAGIDAYKLAKSGVLDSLSIGYSAQDVEFRDDGVRLLKKVDLYEVSIVSIPANSHAIITDVKMDPAKRAIGSHTTAVMEGSWDAGMMMSRLPNTASALRAACAWVDPDGDPTSKSSYKFPHHMVSDDGTVGAANLTACSAGIAALNGGRGGASISDADRAGVWRHLAKHLRDGDKEPPPLKAVVDIETLEGYGLSMDEHIERVRDAALNLKARVDSGMGLRVKEGRKISEARRTFLKDSSGMLRSVADGLDALLEETAPAPKAGINLAYELLLRRQRLGDRLEIQP